MLLLLNSHSAHATLPRRGNREQPRNAEQVLVTMTDHIYTYFPVISLWAHQSIKHYWSYPCLTGCNSNMLTKTLQSNTRPQVPQIEQKTDMQIKSTGLLLPFRSLICCNMLVKSRQIRAFLSSAQNWLQHSFSCLTFLSFLLIAQPGLDVASTESCLLTDTVNSKPFFFFLKRNIHEHGVELLKFIMQSRVVSSVLEGSFTHSCFSKQ